MSDDLSTNPEWIADCIRHHGRVLTGKKAHWCYDWDGMPVDETVDEFAGCGERWEEP